MKVLAQAVVSSEGPLGKDTLPAHVVVGRTQFLVVGGLGGLFP